MIIGAADVNTARAKADLASRTLGRDANVTVLSAAEWGAAESGFDPSTLDAGTLEADRLERTFDADALPGGFEIYSITI